MSKKQTTQVSKVKDLAHWENEYQYFLDAIRGVEMSYALLCEMRDRALTELEKLTPERSDL